MLKNRKLVAIFLALVAILLAVGVVFSAKPNQPSEVKTDTIQPPQKTEITQPTNPNAKLFHHDQLGLVFEYDQTMGEASYKREVDAAEGLSYDVIRFSNSPVVITIGLDLAGYSQPDASYTPELIQSADGNTFMFYVVTVSDPEYSDYPVSSHRYVNDTTLSIVGELTAVEKPNLEKIITQIKLITSTLRYNPT